jgi:hypothetical protein
VLDLPDAARWESWLAAEHEVQAEAWLRIARAHSGIVSVTPQIWLRLPISRTFPPVAGEAAVAARGDPGRKETALCHGRLESEGGDIDEPPKQARRIRIYRP